MINSVEMTKENQKQNFFEFIARGKGIDIKGKTKFAGDMQKLVWLKMLRGKTRTTSVTM